MSKTQNTKGFTLIEILVGLAAFGLAMAAAGGILYGIYKDWQKQRDYLQCIENARWAMEFMTNEIRLAGQVIIPPPAGGEMRFSIDPDADGNPPFRTIRYERQAALLRRCWMQPGVPGVWQPWQELANFVVDNPDLVDNTTGLPPPDGLEDDSIFFESAGLVTVTLTVRPIPTAAEGAGNLNYTLRTQVRVRN